MRHIYLSPHLDDAVLSCGGAIHCQLAAGEQVWVITLIAQDVDPGADLSPFARRLHQDWGNPRRPFALRRAEDLAALTLLGAEAQHLEDLDAIYRAAPDGQWLYPDVGLLFGEVHPADPLAAGGVARMSLPHPAGQGLAERLAPLIPPESGQEPVPAEARVIYAPLGVGRHVDHQIVHAAARSLLALGFQVVFYEDYPYAETPGAVEAALAAAGAQRWQCRVIPLAAENMAAKVLALGYYRSQMPILFGGAELMPSRVWAFASTRSPEFGLAERTWWP